MTNKKIFLGTDDFKELIESNSLYIDKTLLIKELIDNPSKTKKIWKKFKYVYAKLLF